MNDEVRAHPAGTALVDREHACGHDVRMSLCREPRCGWARVARCACGWVRIFPCPVHGRSES